MIFILFIQGFKQYLQPKGKFGTVASNIIVHMSEKHFRPQTSISPETTPCGTLHALALCTVQYIHVPCGFDITNDRNFKRFKKVLLPSTVTLRATSPLLHSHYRYIHISLSISASLQNH